MSSQKGSHGGARKGAGRSPSNRIKNSISIFLEPEKWEILKEEANQQNRDEVNHKKITVSSLINKTVDDFATDLLPVKKNWQQHIYKQLSRTKIQLLHLRNQGKLVNNLPIDAINLDESYSILLNELERLFSMLEYAELPLLCEGNLQKLNSGEYGLTMQYKYSQGDWIEFNNSDPENNNWLLSQLVKIKDEYKLDRFPEVDLDGLQVRFRNITP